MMNAQPLPRSFFRRPTLVVARQLLGKRLVRLESGEQELSGWITETEAYTGTDDLASHARHGRTRRNEAMWGPPGHAYVYFTYGMHWMLNVVTESEAFPAAVLLRAMLPDQGTEQMRQRRNEKPFSSLANGPAKLCQALAVDGRFDKTDVCSPGSRLQIQPGLDVPERFVTQGPRVGLTHVPEPWRSRPWRYRVAYTPMQKLVEESSR